MKKLLLLSALLLPACAPKSVEEYHSGETDEEIVTLLNARQYGKAVWQMESHYGRNPKDPKEAFLLAQAYLGKSGFEPFAVAAAVSGEQDPKLPDSADLFPECSNAAIAPGEKLDAVCFLKRVYLHGPNPDDPSFARARELFRLAYPDPSATDESINVLIGVTETASAVRRAGLIYLFAQRAGKNPINDADLRWLLQQSKRMLNEADQALQRAQYSGQKISHLLTGNQQNDWFVPVKDGVHWANDMGLGSLVDFLRQDVLKGQDEEKYGKILDRIQEILKEREKQLAAG